VGHESSYSILSRYSGKKGMHHLDEGKGAKERKILKETHKHLKKGPSSTEGKVFGRKGGSV